MSRSFFYYYFHTDLSTLCVLLLLCRCRRKFRRKSNFMILFIHSTMKYRIELQILNIDFIGAPTHSMTMPGCVCTYHSNFYRDRHNIVVSQVQPHNFHVLFFFQSCEKSNE